jgi:N-acetyl-anhydromuramoyl-L-alanine amidase
MATTRSEARTIAGLQLDTKGMKRATWTQGWWAYARHRPSPNAGPRPAAAVVDLVVLHSISLPPGVYGGDAIGRLFTNQLDWTAHPYFEQIRGLLVSAHFVIDRRGRITQFVSCDQRAWHAGTSHWQGRDNCNDFSIGIELEGLEGDTFEPAQYRSLTHLLRSLRRQHGVRAVVGHEHVAPGRKADPGPGFEWGYLRQCLGWGDQCFPASENHLTST